MNEELLSILQVLLEALRTTPIDPRRLLRLSELPLDLVETLLQVAALLLQRLGFHWVAPARSVTVAASSCVGQLSFSLGDLVEELGVGHSTNRDVNMVLLTTAMVMSRLAPTCISASAGSEMATEVWPATIFRQRR